MIKAEILVTSPLLRALPLSWTTYVRFGKTVFFISLRKLSFMTINLSTLMPPEVDPAQAPQIIRKIVRNRENGPQDSTPSKEKPVEVTAETIWKTG